MQLSLDRLTTSCEMPAAVEREADTFGGEAREIDGAAVARHRGGQRPLDIAAEPRRHSDPLGRDQTFDQALCCNSTPASGLSIVSIDVARTSA
jgi:hypothetical protein